MKSTTAYANTNIAFIKYWGKNQKALNRNLPAVGSISMTLDEIGTKTTVAPAAADSFQLNGVPMQGEAADKVFKFLDRVCTEHKLSRHTAAVTSVNSVPTAAGLASSASAFCALALAASRAFGAELTPQLLSGLARQGSASAARSVFGGFVELPASLEGEEVYASQVMDEKTWDVRLVVAKTTDKEKAIHSRAGMQHTAETSQYYPSWVSEWRKDFDAGRAALLKKDLQALGEAMEHSTMTMHATTMAARPPFLYWNGATVDCMHMVWELRKQGTLCYFTADAGPHVKVLCAPADVEKIRHHLARVPGVRETLAHKAGGPVRVVE